MPFNDRRDRMTIEVNEIKRVFRYNGIALPDIPGMTPQAVRDFYSAQYPELVSAEIEAGEPRDGQREYTFRKVVGTKGGGGEETLAALKAVVAQEASGRAKDGADKLAHALTRRGMKKRAQAWDAFADCGSPDMRMRLVPRPPMASDMLAPVA
jgi:PRTRC genetic system protein C